MEDLAAEIQYIKVKGVSYSNKECKKCHKGIANFEQSRCEVCPKNEYLDDLAAAGGECKKCPETHFSPPGSIGISSCQERKPCKEDDYTHSFTQCDQNVRTKSYYWKMPRICDTNVTNGSVELPEDEQIPCRGCGRGQFRNASIRSTLIPDCEFCPTGWF